MKRFPLVTMLLAATASATADSTTETLARLHGEPVSLLDWGIFQLEAELQSVRRNDKDFIRAYYVPQSQRIRVDAVFLVPKEEVDAISARTACYVRHHAIKLTLGIIDTERLTLAPAAEFRLGSKFSHQNPEAYRNAPDVGEVGTALIKIVDVHVGIVTSEDAFPFDQSMRCDGPAYSQEVKYHVPDTEDVLRQ